MSGAKLVLVKLPEFSGKDEENYQEFEKELRAAFRSNKVAKSEQVKTLRDCLKGHPLSMESIHLKDIEVALGMLSTVHSNLL